MTKEINVKKFNNDVTVNEGYLYTTKEKLSSWIANKRLTDVTIKALQLEGKRVIDVGCGDGTYTIQLMREKPKHMVGIDIKI